MSYPAFAYTKGMQWILFFVVIATNFLFFWYITNFLLTIFGEKSSIRQRIIFVLLVGTGMNTFWIYGFYLVIGSIRFNEFSYLLLSTPNPIFAMLYCLIAIKVLKLPTYRAVHMMRHVYLYIVLSKVIVEIIGKSFFAQHESSYNYMLDAIALCVCAVVTTTIYYIIKLVLHRTAFLFRITDRLYINFIGLELAINFIHACAVYVTVIIFPAIMISWLYGYLTAAGILLLALAVTILIDYKSAIEFELQNKDVYIGTLTNSIDQFSGVKHDFYNMLQTYSGYIEINDMVNLKKYHEKLLGTTLFAGDQINLTQHMQQNPALVSLLIKKLEFSKSLDVQLRVNILCSLDELYISDFDICRILGNLLDNAIEAAAESQQKHISFSVEKKLCSSRLFVISNSTKDVINLNTITVAGVTTKKGHSGIGLTQVRNILNKYPLCSLQFGYYNHEFSVYIETNKNASKVSY